MPATTSPREMQALGVELGDLGERELLETATARRRTRRLAEVDEMLAGPSGRWSRVSHAASGTR